MASDPRAASMQANFTEAPSQVSATAGEADAVALHLPHLERSMKIVQRYAAVYSNAPFVSNVPLFGPIIVLAKNIARRVLRVGLSAAFGSQAEFNAAAAEILFEFTRRAALSQNLPDEEMRIAQLLERGAQSGQRDDRTALEEVVRELAVLRESVRAANLAAAEAESQVMELRRQVEKLKRAGP